MNKLLLLLAVMVAASKSSALVLDCTSKQISKPWNEIVSITSEVQFPSLREASPIEFSIDLLESFGDFKFQKAVFVVDYNKEKRTSRLEIPLLLWRNGQKMGGRVSLGPQELGKHGVLLVWEESEWHCESSKYFPLDA